MASGYGSYDPPPGLRHFLAPAPPPNNGRIMTTSSLQQAAVVNSYTPDDASCTSNTFLVAASPAAYSCPQQEYPQRQKMLEPNQIVCVLCDEHFSMDSILPHVARHFRYSLYSCADCGAAGHCSDSMHLHGQMTGHRIIDGQTADKEAHDLTMKTVQRCYKIVDGDGTNGDVSSNESQDQDLSLLLNTGSPKKQFSRSTRQRKTTEACASNANHLQTAQSEKREQHADSDISFYGRRRTAVANFGKQEQQQEQQPQKPQQSSLAHRRRFARKPSFPVRKHVSTAASSIARRAFTNHTNNVAVQKVSTIGLPSPQRKPIFTSPSRPIQKQSTVGFSSPPARTELTLEQRVEILRALETNEMGRDVARRFGVSASVVSRIGKRREELLELYESGKTAASQSQKQPISVGHTCSDCGRSFELLRHLKCHVKYCKAVGNNHNGSPAAAPAVKTGRHRFSSRRIYVCASCGQRFRKSFLLRKHQRRVHRVTSKEQEKNSANSSMLSATSESAEDTSFEIDSKLNATGPGVSRAAVRKLKKSRFSGVIRFSTEQRKMLETEFQRSRNCNWDRAIELSGPMGLTERQVHNWFINRKRPRKRPSSSYGYAASVIVADPNQSTSTLTLLPIITDASTLRQPPAAAPLDREETTGDESEMTPEYGDEEEEEDSTAYFPSHNDDA